MATTLATLRDRVEIVLQDTGNLIFATTDVDEGIGQALAEYNLALGKTATINGLGQNNTTTLEEASEGPLVQAAAAYVVLSRVQERLETVNLGQDAPLSMNTWAENRLGVWRRQLEHLRVRGLLAGAKPWQDKESRWVVDGDEAV